MVDRQYRDLISRDDIHFANGNNSKAKKALLRTIYRNLKKRQGLKQSLLSIITFGYHSYSLKQLALQILTDLLAERKLKHFRFLREQIEHLREEHCTMDPRQEINEIFMKIQMIKTEEGERGVELKKIYSPNELLMFITSPPKDNKVIRQPRALTHNNGNIKIWRAIRKRAREKQYHQIDQINTCNAILRDEYLLSSEAIADRLLRTSIAKDSRASLTRLKSLLSAFQEVVLAHQEFEELADDDRSLHSMLEFLQSLSKEETEQIDAFVHESKSAKDLPIHMRKSVIRIANQTDVIERILQQKLGHLVELVLSSYQWNLFLHMQNPNKSTLKLLNWAYHQSCAVTHEVDFSELREKNEFVLEHRNDYSELLTEIDEDEKFDGMIVEFANEIHREWPSALVYNQGKEIFFLDRCESMTSCNLVALFQALKTLAEEDTSCLELMQDIVSRKGKEVLLRHIRGELNNLLGEASEYFIPVYSIEHIDIHKHSPTLFQVVFHFHYKVFQKEQKKIEFEQNDDTHVIIELKKEEDVWKLLHRQNVEEKNGQEGENPVS